MPAHRLWMKSGASGRAKDLDLSTVADEAKPYVAAILTGVVIRHFVEAIAFERGHSLDVRRYMWQMQY